MAKRFDASTVILPLIGVAVVLLVWTILSLTVARDLPSPLKTWLPFPTIVAMVPPTVNWRIRLLLVSATITTPADGTAMLLGKFRSAVVAAIASPLYPAVVASDPAIVETPAPLAERILLFDESAT